MRHFHKFILFSGLLFCSFQNEEQESIDFYNGIKQYDISAVWTLDKIIVEAGKETFDRPEPLGYLGDDFYRFNIHFFSAIQNRDNPYQYFVFGKTRFKNNICSFQGLISITEAKVYKTSDAPGFKQGYIDAKYEFYEDSKQKGSGKFFGTCHSNFIIDKDNKLRYDALMAVADGFSNNEFKGFWQDYQSKDKKKCNWGDFRIPDSEQLDGGAGEFVPTDKYVSNGWANYEKAQIGSADSPETKKAIEIENQKWWK